MTVNIRQEIERMKLHRAAYFPVMKKLLLTHKEMHGRSFPVEFSEMEEMMIILELLDVGYLDKNSFKVTGSFGNVEALSYNRKYPLTRSGESALKQMEEIGRKKNLYITILLCSGTVLIFFIFLLIKVLKY